MYDYVIIDGPGATNLAPVVPTITLRSTLTLAQRVKLETLGETSALARVIIAELDAPVTAAISAALVDLGVIESQVIA